MPPIRPKDLPIDTNIDGTESVLVDGVDGVRRIPISTLVSTVQALIVPGGRVRFVTDIPDNATGLNGDICWRDTGQIYQRESGVYVLKFTIPLGTTQPPDPDPPPPTNLQSDNGTFVPDDADFIYTANGDTFRLGAASGSDFRILLNGVEMAGYVAGVGLLYYAPPPSTSRSVYHVNNAGNWFIYTGAGTGYNGNGWTNVAGDPRPYDESMRDPTVAVAIKTDGHYVYRFAAAHADPVTPWVIPNFDASNDGGHDIIKGLDEVLTELGKTEGDITISYPGTPDARLVIDGTSFQIDFTAVDLADASLAPLPFGTPVLVTSTTDNAPNLSLSGTVPAGHSNRLMLVPVELRSNGTAGEFASVTLNGVAMQRYAPADQVGYGNATRTAWFYKVAPAEGAAAVLVAYDYSAGKTSTGVAAAMILLENVNQADPFGDNVGFLWGSQPTINMAIDTEFDNSLLVAQNLAFSPNTNPVVPGPDVTPLFGNEIDVGIFSDPGAFGAWFATKPAVTSGANNLAGTIGQDAMNGSVIEVRGVATSDLFDIGPYATTNVAGGGPDIATDTAPADWPVPDGTGLGGGGSNPTPSTFWEGVLTSHGWNSHLDRSWTNTELASFAVQASAARLFGYVRRAPYTSFAADANNISLIERCMTAGMKVLYCPLYSEVGAAPFPAASDTTLVNTYKARLADIAATALSRGWPVDAFCLEMYNEPLSSLGQANVVQVYQAMVYAIRAANPDIWLAAMGNGYEAGVWEAYYAGWLRSGKLIDPRSGEHRIAYGTHHYLPMEYTHQGTSGNFPTGVSWPLSYYGLTQLRAQMSEFRNWANANSVQIYDGECGASRYAPSLANRLQYVSDLFLASKENAIPTFLFTGDTSGDGGTSWFPAMEGPAGNSYFKAEWAALVGASGV